MLHLKESFPMDDTSSINICDLCATKHMKTLDMLHNIALLNNTIVEIGEKARCTIERKDIINEGMYK